MACKSHLVLVRVSAFLFLLTWNFDLFASIRPETKNRMHLDRWMCTIKNPQIVKTFDCDVRYISRGHLKVYAKVEFRSQLRLWFHTIFYHKFNGIVYSKFPIDHWESLCDFVDGKREKTFLQNWIFTRILKYSNFNHSCPYSNALIKADNVSVEKTFPFTEAILPSGRYRVVISITGDDRVPISEVEMIGSNSEHYLEKI